MCVDGRRRYCEVGRLIRDVRLSVMREARRRSWRASIKELRESTSTTTRSGIAGGFHGGATLRSRQEERRRATDPGRGWISLSGVGELRLNGWVGQRHLVCHTRTRFTCRCRCGLSVNQETECIQISPTYRHHDLGVPYSSSPSPSSAFCTELSRQLQSPSRRVCPDVIRQDDDRRASGASTHA